MEDIKNELVEEKKEEQEIIPHNLFGVYHWMMLLRVEGWVVMNNGEIEAERMRTNFNRRPPAPKGKQWDKLIHSTRTNKGTLIDDHDDWDCLNDLVALGLVNIDIWKNKKIVSLTETGFQVYVRLRRYRQNGEDLNKFVY